MSIVCVIKDKGQSGSVSQRTYTYVCKGTGGDVDMTEAAVINALVGGSPQAALSIPDGLGSTLYAKDASVDTLYQTPNEAVAVASVEYGPAEAPSQLDEEETEPTADSTYEFSYQAPSAHIYYALSTTAHGTNPPDFGDKIRCKYDGQDLIHEGIDLPSGNTTNIWRLSAPRGFLSGSYEALVEGMMGTVNDATFKGRPAGSMRFVQCQSSITSGGSLNISWGFQYVQNRTGVTIGGISGISIKGHQIWWTLDEKTLDLTAKKMVLTPRAVYVQTIFGESDFDDLNI